MTPPGNRRAPRRRIRSAAELKRSAFRVGGLTLLVIALATYLGFTKHIPFTHGFRVHAVFASANSIRKNSPVRIAGVNVGKVTGVSRQSGTDAAIVTMELSQDALPLHHDATFKIRPRIFLEGNFFVDVSPGTPGSPVVHEGDTLPITQTAAPVQFDQVLTALQSDTRVRLQNVLVDYGRALTYQPTAADDARQDPIVAGLTAAQALNRSLRYSASGFRDSAIVGQSLLGTEPHDVSGLVAGLGKVTGALDRVEAQLGDLVTNFNTTMGAFASQAGNVRTTIALLAPTLQNANAALTDLNRSFPPTRAFAREILPGVRETPATINAAFPWIAQTRGLLGANELRGLALQLQPAIGDLAAVIDGSTLLLPQTDLTSKCLSNVVLPTGNIPIQDGPLSTGTENYKEFWYTMVGLAGESQNFDANGEYVRFQPGGGDQTVSTGAIGGSAANALFGNNAAQPLGTRPAYPGHRPPYHPEVPCYTQHVPSLNSAATGPPDASVPGASTRGGRRR
ncbi:MAG TPA: MlaD family protein [Solirubrobacteraceae bacterium]|jgi:ABC-type transporter Mla subunit MlaD|nr:MlaD family protein [Solirubrobacteraceae bacterium]